MAWQCLARRVVLSLAVLSGSVPAFAVEPDPTGDPAKASDAPKKKPIAVALGKDTTYLDSPLRADGYPDYLAVINRLASEGVTPENNAAVLLARALGPGVVERQDRKRFFEKLGMEAPPEQGGYFLEYFAYVEKYAPGELKRQERDGESFCPAFEEYRRFESGPWPAEQCPLAAAWLTHNQEALALVAEASQRTRYYVPLLDNGAPGMGRHISRTFRDEVYAVRYIGRALHARAMLELHNGEIAKAWSDLQVCHRLARLAGQGKTWFEGTVAIAVATTAWDGQQRIAHHTRLTPEQFRQFTADLDRLPPLPMTTEKSCLEGRFTYLALVCDTAAHRKLPAGFLQEPPELTEFFARLSKEMEEEGFKFAEPRDPDREYRPLRKMLQGWIDDSQMEWDEVLRLGNKQFDRLAAAGAERDLRRRQKAMSALEEDYNALRQATLKQLESSGGSPSKDTIARMFAVSYLDALGFRGLVRPWEHHSLMYGPLTKVALALGAYCSDKDRYPRTLDALTSKYLPQVPADPLGTGQIRYRRIKDGYFLYSVGPNGRDDGGPRAEGWAVDDDPQQKSDDYGIRMAPSSGWPDTRDDDGR